MRDAVAADFAAVPGVQVILPGERRGVSPTWVGADTSGLRPDARLELEFSEVAATADFTLVIAPECGGRLEHLCREVMRVGGRLLGPSPDAVRLTADKLALSQRWRTRRVPTPTTWRLGEELPGVPVVIKPRDGAGSQAMCLSVGTDLRSVRPGSPGWAGWTDRRSVPTETWPGPMIAQQHISGFAASVAFLVGPSQTVALAPCEQLLSADGRFTYLGGRLPLSPNLADRAIRIATAAVQCVPGLSGYVGVDVVLGDDGRDWAIEINPRLTTSYVGLRRLARSNLAAAMLAIVRGEPITPLDWEGGPIEFTPDGFTSVQGS
jgi:predicted ATP-grasp superfamily ATP-dependent carboligase